MFNVGPGELIAILALALIVLGPNRLPEAVRTVGRVVGELRRISSGFQEELRNALEDSEVESDIDRIRSVDKTDEDAKTDEVELPPGPAAAVQFPTGAEPIDVDVIDTSSSDGKDPSIDDDPPAPLTPEPVAPEAEVPEAIAPADEEPPADGERAAS
jgi:sec-independent protein translocase protein TatB